MPKIDISAIPLKDTTVYPPPFHAAVKGRLKKQLALAAGLTQFGVNLTELAPGAQSALRHWHENEDEFVYVLSGELVLVDEDGEHPMLPGDCAAFKAGDPNAHHFINRSAAPATILEIGTRAKTERAHYPDVDLAFEKTRSGFSFLHKDGRPYEEELTTQ